MLNRQFKRNIPLLLLSCVLFVTLLKLERRNLHEELSRQIAEEVSMKAAVPVRIAEQNSTKSTICDNSTVIMSAKLESRFPWQEDQQCSKYQIRHMLSHCRPPIALASYPGSGNTWVRYLIEGATGIFTGSRYKDLEIQMYGLYGEIRVWTDGTTIVQKTHDASKNHVQKDYGGRGILILRNPYSAILSGHNFLFAGHHGRAPDKNFDRKDWTQFVTIQASKWLDMATNWTVYGNPDKVLVLHYENLQSNLLPEMRRILHFLGLPVDEDRLSCMSRHRGGFFQRKQDKEPERVPFNQKLRKEMDLLIDGVNCLLKERGFEEMPRESYEFYRKTDEEILANIRSKNENRKNVVYHDESTSSKLDKSHGTKMVIKHYLKWLEGSEEKGLKMGFDDTEDMKTLLMKQLFKKFRENSKAKTITGLSEQAEGLLTKAVEIWPIIQKPFQKDPIEDAISTDSFRGMEVKDLLPMLKELTDEGNCRS